MARRVDPGKQERWLELMQRWRRSPTTIREFCERQRVSEASFFSWRRVLRQRGLLDESLAAETETSAATPAFVKLTTVVANSSPTVSAIELVLSQRRVLRVQPGFDANLLLELVRLLEEPAC
jgi:hypothetical protein